MAWIRRWGGLIEERFEKNERSDTMTKQQVFSLLRMLVFGSYGSALAIVFLTHGYPWSDWLLVIPFLLLVSAIYLYWTHRDFFIPVQNSKHTSSLWTEDLSWRNSLLVGSVIVLSGLLFGFGFVYLSQFYDFSRFAFLNTLIP